MAERMIDVDGVELCTESFGDPAAPPLLLVMGIGASMLWWEEGFCRLLADGGRRVIRYDHRDTGRSATSAPGRPDYGGADLAADVVRVLDAHELPAAHLVGVSAGGAFAQLLALEQPERVRSLVLISTTAAVPTARPLPPPTDAFGRGVAELTVDWSDPASVIEHTVAYAAVLAGEQRPFAAEPVRDLARREVERARDVAAAQNHNLLREDDDPDADPGPLSAIAAPTLVIHGSADPLFPLEHGAALADEIPGARLLRLEGAGHGVERTDWEAIAGAILSHTAEPPRSPRVTSR